MEMYECTRCGYVYNPQVGDATQQISPGTPFGKLPASWVCPRCRADRSKFRRIEV